jgi:prepilin-type N-terminal cleavage/methylation domain-containing protein
MLSVASSADDQRGFTLVEVMVAAFVLVVGVLGTVALIDRANATTVKTKSREAATNLARTLTETAQSIPYPLLTNGTVLQQLSARPGLNDPDGLANGYQLTRRGFSFTVTATVCSVDDPKDNYGLHDASSFCAPSSGSADRNPDDYKRVVIKLSWREDSRGLSQTTLVNNPGSTAGPAVWDLTMTQPIAGGTSVSDSAVGTASFQVKTSAPPHTVSWFLDGVFQGSASGSGTTWNFDWSLTDVVDGTYEVSAQAFDDHGVSGASRVLTVRVNRYPPEKPRNLLVGRNGSIVDIEWAANRERDVVGYTVYRRDGTVNTPVCLRVRTTSCQDTSPPAGDPLSYFVVGVDLLDDNSFREGAASDDARTTVGNQPPNPPTSLVASAFGGTTILRWHAPATPDPDAGDSIAYYRIYRDGTRYADRYGRTDSGSDLTWTDVDRGGTSHQYWVVAVDTHLAESTPLGPVTR